jgi:hypothetical protein
MNRKPYQVYNFLLLVFLVFGCERRLCGCVFPVMPLAGTWTLDQITYGPTQKTASAAELGYSQTLSLEGHAGDGSYREFRNGVPIRNGSFSAVFPEGGSAKGILHYPADTTQQSFELKGNQLYLSERIPKGATLADGSLYRYQR